MMRISKATVRATDASLRFLKILRDLRVVRALRVSCGAAAVLLGGFSLHAQQSSAVDKAFAEFWKADDAGRAQRAAERVIKAGVDFETAYARLKAGRSYGNEQTGEIAMRFPAGAGVLFDNLVEIPDDYNSSRPWQLRVQLHGGINRQAPTAVSGGGALEEDESRQGGGAPRVSRPRRDNRIRGENQIYI